MHIFKTFEWEFTFYNQCNWIHILYSRYLKIEVNFKCSREKMRKAHIFYCLLIQSVPLKCAFMQFYKKALKKDWVIIFVSAAVSSTSFEKRWDLKAFAAAVNSVSFETEMHKIFSNINRLLWPAHITKLLYLNEVSHFVAHQLQTNIIK